MDSQNKEPPRNIDITDSQGVTVGDVQTLIQNYYQGFDASFLKRLEEAKSRQGPVAPTIPPLLPYLADRSDQEFRLLEALEVQPPLRPLVMIVHGDELQCHDKFLDRLQQVTLPRLLKLESARGAITAYHLKWPSSLTNWAEFPRRFLMMLSEAVLPHSTGTRDEIQRKIASNPAPVLLHTHLLSTDWKQHGSAVLEHYLRFWQSWPELLPDQQLLIVLFIKYKLADSKKSMLSLAKPLNAQIASQLAALDFSRYAPLTGAVLPPLEGVPQREAEAWARSPDVSAWCDPDVLIREIRELYKRETRGDDRQGICMEKLADWLKSTLKTNASPQESTS